MGNENALKGVGNVPLKLHTNPRTHLYLWRISQQGIELGEWVAKGGVGWGGEQNRKRTDFRCRRCRNYLKIAILWQRTSIFRDFGSFLAISDQNWPNSGKSKRGPTLGHPPSIRSLIISITYTHTIEYRARLYTWYNTIYSIDLISSDSLRLTL